MIPGVPAGSSVQSSTSDRLSSGSGLNQTIGGINNTVTGNNNQALLIAGAVFLLTLIMVARKR